MIKKILFITFSFLFALVQCFASGWKPSDLTDPYTIDKTRYVLDELGYLSISQRDSIDRICDQFNKNVELELAVVLLDRTDMTPFDFGLELYNQWELGKGSRGLLLSIFIEQHKWQFTTGYGAEGVFPDGLLKLAGERRLVPQFKKSNYFEGIRDVLNELYKVAKEEGYSEKEGYTKSSLTSKTNSATSDTPTKNMGENTDSATEDTPASTITILFVQIAFILGPIICLIARKRRDITEVSGSFVKKKEGHRIQFDCTSDNRWHLWANHGCLRYMLVDWGFLIACLISYIKEDSEILSLIAILVYLTYLATVWYVASFSRIDDNCKTSGKRYAALIDMQNSRALKIYKIIAPWVTFYFSKTLKKEIEKVLQEELRCPGCQSDLQPTGIQYRPVTSAEIYEVKNRITKYTSYVCTTHQHNVIVSLPDKDFFEYLTCPSCGGHCAKLIKSAITRMASSYQTGIRSITTKCDLCQKQSTIKVEIPKLPKEISYDRSTSKSDDSSFGGFPDFTGSSSSSSSHSSGGSRSGGSSGGSGASGGW